MIDFRDTVDKVPDPELDDIPDYDPFDDYHASDDYDDEVYCPCGCYLEGRETNERNC